MADSPIRMWENVRVPSDDSTPDIDTLTGQRNHLLKHLREIFWRLLVRGFQLPFQIIGVAHNGSVFAGSLTDAGFIASVEHNVPSGHLLPLHILFVDSSGQGAHVAIQQPDQEEYTLNTWIN